MIATSNSLIGREQRPGDGPRSWLSGTYELETARGDNPEAAADAATRRLSGPQRDRAYRSLLNRLQPPAVVAIDRNGRTITISSSAGPRTVFDADGRTRTEPGGSGRLIRTHAEFSGERLSVSTIGDRNTDFVVTFEPLDGGDGLLVTRRLDSDDLRSPVTLRSYYRRSSGEPRWDVYTRDRNDLDRRPLVPEGMRLVAVLDTSLSSRTSRSGQPLSMTVLAPGEYQGARIDGVVGRITPYARDRNAAMRVEFDTIQLRNGDRAAFDAVLSTVRTPDGGTFRVDTSDDLSDRGHSDEAIQQGAVGAALGAIIGAIAGGGKGAVIGAVAGGAGGAILAQDRSEYLDLPPGTEVTIIVAGTRR